MDLKERVKYLLSHNNFMTIATADSNGKPWTSPVGFAYDKTNNFYWVSSKEALHSKNIEQRREVALSIYGQMPDGSFDGVYVDAQASVLSDNAAIEAAIQLFQAQRPQPSRFVVHSAMDVTGSAAWRMYVAKPVAIYKRADATLNGQAITVREQVEL